MVRLLIILLLFSSCDPVRRHQRLVNKYPYVHKDIENITVDTHIINIPPARITDRIPISDLDVPFTVYKDRLRVEVKNVNDTLYLTAECKDTTVIYEDKIIERVVHSEQPAKKFNWWILVGLLFLLLLLHQRR